MSRWVSKRSGRAACLSLAAWAAFACLAAPNPAHAEEVTYYPGLDIYGTVMVEDSHPGSGDFDFNDMVVRYNFQIRKDASGKVSGLWLTYKPEAKGGVLHLGLAVRLPLLASTPHLAEIQRQGEAPAVVTPVAGETDLVFVLLADVREAFSDPAGGDVEPGELINTDPDLPVRHGKTIQLMIEFSPSVDFVVNFPVDAFIFQTGEFAHQTHLPSFGPTDVALEDPAIADLFGTEDDCSNQVCAAGDGSVVDNTGRWYVDNQGLPWAIDVAAEIQWPAEGKNIRQAYPQFVGWVTSGGETNTDWYLHGDSEYLYNLLLPPTVPGLYPGAAWVLLGIVAALGALRLRRSR